MEFKDYKCPVCEAVVPRDLIIFLDHTNQHILDKVKERHPDWAAHEGVCPCKSCAPHQHAGIDSVIQHSFGINSKAPLNPIRTFTEFIKSVPLPKLPPLIPGGKEVTPN